jgi:hypothetical protein
MSYCSLSRKSTPTFWLLRIMFARLSNLEDVSKAMKFVPYSILCKTISTFYFRSIFVRVFSFENRFIQWFIVILANSYIVKSCVFCLFVDTDYWCIFIQFSKNPDFLYIRIQLQKKSWRYKGNDFATEKYHK